jgi:hypothetical protein
MYNIYYTISYAYIINSQKIKKRGYLIHNSPAFREKYYLPEVTLPITLVSNVF